MQQHKRSKIMIIMLISLAILFGAIFGFKGFMSMMMAKYMKAAAVQVATVSTIKAEFQPWQNTATAVASMRAIRGVDVTTELAGMVQSIYFVPGSNVKKGDLLVDLNAATDIAKLNSLKANEALAEVVYNRDKAQYAIKAVSKAVVDADEANLKNTKAQVAEQQATVDKKKIRAPFSGRLGVSQINPGQYLNPGDKIVTLQQLAPIYADFFLPQQKLVEMTVGLPVSLKSDTYPKQSFPGKITTINPQVDTETRNVQIEATLANEQQRLLPGMFGTVTINIGKPQQYLTLPVSSVSFNPYGEIVFIVKQQGKDDQGKPKYIANQSFVTVGDTRGDQIAILSGIKEGDQIVTSGQLKLRNGSQVVINNKVVPSNNPQPVVKNQ